MDKTEPRFRYLIRRIFPEIHLYTEMIGASAILHGSCSRFFDLHPEEPPVALQLGTNCPEEAYRAVLLARQYFAAPNNEGNEGNQGNRGNQARRFCRIQPECRLPKRPRTKPQYRRHFDERCAACCRYSCGDAAGAARQCRLVPPKKQKPQKLGKAGPNGAKHARAADGHAKAALGHSPKKPRYRNE